MSKETKQLEEQTEEKKNKRGLATGVHISVVDQIKRLKEIQDLVNQGLSVQEIAQKLNISEPVTHNNIKYLKDLQIADLTSADIADKRAELYMSLSEIEFETKNQYELYKDVKSSAGDARSYLRLWKEIIEAKAKMFGVDQIKTEGIIINQQINAGGNNGNYEKERVPKDIKDKLAKALIDQHEAEIKKKYDSEDQDL